jgi:hypothetical protein
MSLPSDETLVARWNQHIDAARSAWSRLTEDELRRCQGDADALARLVRERYTLSRAAAERQVRVFLQSLQSSDVH